MICFGLLDGIAHDLVYWLHFKHGQAWFQRVKVRTRHGMVKWGLEASFK